MISPVDPETTTWPEVPVKEETPDVVVEVFVIVIPPDELVTEIPEPAVKLAKVKLAPFPIGI